MRRRMTCHQMKSVCAARGASHNPLSADLIHGHRSTFGVGWQNSAKYSGARPLTHLRVAAEILVFLNWSQQNFLSIDDYFKVRYVLGMRGHRHAYKLFKPRCTASIRSNFFAERVTNIWNSLPVSVNFSTLKSFRRTIQSRFFIVFKV